MIKISELTPKGANLQNSDLLEVSVTTADGYESKSITGAEIITAAQSGLQPTLVSGTNIKTINGSSLLGTGDLTISGSNIYNADGTLTGARTLTLGGVALTIEGTTSSRFQANGNLGIGTTTDAGFKLDVNGTARVSGNLTLTGGSLLMNNNNIYIARGTGTPTNGMEIRALSAGTDAVKVTTSSVSISSVGGLTYQASAQLAVDSTTRGFLPPRMTNAQMLAIATPAAGLVVYDTTNNKHCGYNGTAWQNFY